jgi:phosphohistidine swiveling domain-containing protein
MARTFPEFGYNPVTGEWNDSLSGDFLWSNVNVSEAVPDVMTPSTWSLWWIHHYEANLFEFPGDYRFCGNICGRPYLNLSLIFSVYRAIGKNARKELQADAIGSAPPDFDIPTIRFSAFQVLRTMLPSLLRAQAQASRDQKATPEFLATMPDWCRSTRNTIQGCLETKNLLSLWQAEIKPTVFRACQMLRSVTMNMADPATKLRQHLSILVGEADANAILSNLSGSASDLESLGPLLGLAKVRDGRMSGAEYLERYGHRSPHEMELSAPGPEDDPAWLEKRLAEFDRSKADVGDLLEKQRIEAQAAWQRFETRFPKKVNATRQALDKVSAAARSREAVRSEVTRLARLVRTLLLQAGTLTGLGDDVFFLSLDELARVLAGDETPIPYIPTRRVAHERYCALPPYPAMIVGHFDPFEWAAGAKRRSDFFDSRQPASTPPTGTIHGYAGAAGVVEGMVRKLDRPEDGDQLQAGEILVAVTTNVGWTPLFPRLAAIVTDVGAPLSHAAIVARELGIPAVVGCGDATARLKTGDRIRVDGSAGTVTLV